MTEKSPKEMTIEELIAERNAIIAQLPQHIAIELLKQYNEKLTAILNPDQNGST